MAKEKVYKLAQEFKVSSEALVQMLRQMGIPVKSHMSTVDENLRDEIKKKFEQERAEIKKEYERKKQMITKAKEDLLIKIEKAEEEQAEAAKKPAQQPPVEPAAEEKEKKPRKRDFAAAEFRRDEVRRGSRPRISPRRAAPRRRRFPKSKATGDLKRAGKKAVKRDSSGRRSTKYNSRPISRKRSPKSGQAPSARNIRRKPAEGRRRGDRQENAERQRIRHRGGARQYDAGAGARGHREMP